VPQQHQQQQQPASIDLRIMLAREQRPRGGGGEPADLGVHTQHEITAATANGERLDVDWPDSAAARSYPPTSQP